MSCTLCWDCKKSTNSCCPWSRDFKEVPGWNAKKTTIKIDSSGTKIDSYIVKDCSLFEDDSNRKLRLEYFEKYYIGPRIFYFLLNNGYIGYDGELFKDKEIAYIWSKRAINERRKKYLRRMGYD